MDENTFQAPPAALEAIMARTREAGFQSWSWPQVGALLRVMAASKPGGRLLEIGTGTGVGTCWMLDGMDAAARLITVETNSAVQAIARSCLETDPRLTLLCEDAAATIRRQRPDTFDLVFADGSVGKHIMLDEALALLRPGGIYICDDMKPHPMWPPEHAAKIPPLVEVLASKQGFRRSYIDWSSGVVVMVKLGK
jgi:predicted O-methyltransferase YrrM